MSEDDFYSLPGNTSDEDTIAKPVVKTEDETRPSLMGHAPRAVEEFTDYTTPSPLEKLSRSIEVALKGMKLSDALSSSTAQSTSVTCYSESIKLHLSVVLMGTPSTLDPLDRDGIHRLFGVDHYVLITSDSAIDSSLCNFLLSATFLSLWNLQLPLPVFVQAQKVYAGQSSLALQASSTYRSLLEYYPDASLMYVSGLVDRFALWSKLNPRQRKRVSVDIRLAFNSPNIAGRTLRLFVTWKSQNASQIVDNSACSELDAAASRLWTLKLRKKRAKPMSLLWHRRLLHILAMRRAELVGTSSVIKNLLSPSDDSLTERVGACFYAGAGSMSLLEISKSCKGVSSAANPFLNFAILACELKTPEIIGKAWRKFLYILRSKCESGISFYPCPERVNFDQCLIAQRLEALQLCMRGSGSLPQTEDAQKIEEFILQALDNDARVEYLSRHLSRDMSIFKFENAHAKLVDFVKFFSPRDVDGAGNLSRRFQAGNAWERVWQQSSPLSVKNLPPVWNPALEAEKCLDALENCEDLFGQIFFAVTSAALQDLCEAPGLKNLLEIAKETLIGDVPSSNPTGVFFPTATELDRFLENFALFEDNAQTAAALATELDDSIISDLLAGRRVPIIETRAAVERLFYATGLSRPWTTEPSRKEVLLKFEKPGNFSTRLYAKIRGVRIEAGFTEVNNF